MIGSSTRRAPSLLLLLIALLAPHAPSAAGGELSHQSVAAGITVIHASGTAGISLQIPRETSLPAENIDFQLHEGDFGFAGLAPRACDSEAVSWNTTCMWWQAFYVAETDFESGGYFNPNVSAPDPATVGPGVLDVYFTGNEDAKVTLTLTFPGLEGSSEVSAGGAIDAVAVSPNVTCEETQGNCESFGHGGDARQSSDRAFAAALAYAWNPWDPDDDVGNRGSASAVACLYPDPFFSPNASPDPDDHPRGCDILPTDADNDPNRGRIFLNHAVTSVISGGTFSGWLERNYAANDPQYAGFAAERVSLLEPGGGYGGWAVWVGIGIQPGGD